MIHLQMRKAKPADGGILNNIKRAASLVSDEYRAALLVHPEQLTVSDERIRSGHVIIAEEKGKIVGLAEISLREDGLELDGLFVDPPMWRRGIGRFLVDGAVARIGGDVTAKALHVVASPDAKAFYLACGFEAVSSTSTRFGPALRMKRYAPR